HSSTPITTPAFYPLPLHDALPISRRKIRNTDTFCPLPGRNVDWSSRHPEASTASICSATPDSDPPQLSFHPPSLTRQANTCLPRSEEHTSELQSLTNLVCRLLPEK